MSGPTLSGFTWFIENIAGIPVEYLPSTAPVISWAFDIAEITANRRFKTIPQSVAAAPQSIFTQMVYNLGTHDVISWAPDVQPPVAYKIDQNGNSIGYFEYLRQNFGLNSFLPGIVTATYDQGTGTSLLVPEGLKNLTIADLALTKTPWGRTYLGLAMAWNRPWGLA